MSTASLFTSTTNSMASLIIPSVRTRMSTAASSSSSSTPSTWTRIASTSSSTSSSVSSTWPRTELTVSVIVTSTACSSSTSDESPSTRLAAGSGGERDEVVSVLATFRSVSRRALARGMVSSMVSRSSPICVTSGSDLSRASTAVLTSSESDATVSSTSRTASNTDSTMSRVTTRKPPMVARLQSGENVPSSCFSVLHTTSWVSTKRPRVRDTISWPSSLKRPA
mmetsp:Transcript_15207/g.51542  ORF Transcript_15207/g.51542 Transcript_15207/m.51542 type:complete len:224 (+) Transcript_15207:1356-2027(+)